MHEPVVTELTANHALCTAANLLTTAAHNAHSTRTHTPMSSYAVSDAGIPGFNSRLDAFRAWARLTWMKLRRARSDEPWYLCACSPYNISPVRHFDFPRGRLST